MFKYIVTVVAIVAFSYTAGYTQSKSTYLEYSLKERTELVLAYEEQLNQLRHKQQELEALAARYRDDARNVHASADRLRAELASQRSAARDITQSITSTGADCRRCEQMAEALRIATNLIEERDRIALQYNELRSSCNIH